MKHAAAIIGFCLILLFSSGCIAVMQTSVRICEDRTFFYFPIPDNVNKMYSLDGNIYINCPLEKRIRKNSLVVVCATPSFFGGYHSEFHALAEPEKTVWLRKEISGEKEPKISYHYDASDKNLQERLLKYGKELPLPPKSPSLKTAEDIFNSMIKYHYGDWNLDAPWWPDSIYLPQIYSESENGFFRTSLAVLSGIVIDFPCSLFMTLTGSLWYIPLTKY